MNELYLPIPYAEALRTRDPAIGRERAIRFMSDTRGVSWRLQIRTPVAARGRDGKDFIIAIASLNVDAVRSLRDACDEALKDNIDLITKVR